MPLGEFEEHAVKLLLQAHDVYSAIEEFPLLLRGEEAVLFDYTSQVRGLLHKMRETLLLMSAYRDAHDNSANVLQEGWALYAVCHEGLYQVSCFVRDYLLFLLEEKRLYTMLDSEFKRWDLFIEEAKAVGSQNVAAFEECLKQIDKTRAGVHELMAKVGEQHNNIIQKGKEATDFVKPILSLVGAKIFEHVTCFNGWRQSQNKSPIIGFQGLSEQV